MPADSVRTMSDIKKATLHLVWRVFWSLPQPSRQPATAMTRRVARRPRLQRAATVEGGARVPGEDDLRAAGW